MSDLIRKIAEYLGLKNSETDKLKKKRLLIVNSRDQSQDYLDQLTDEVKRYENIMRQQKDELQNASGAMRGIIERKLEINYERLKLVLNNIEGVFRFIKNSDVLLNIIDGKLLNPVAVTIDEVEELNVQTENMMMDLKELSAAVQEGRKLSTFETGSGAVAETPAEKQKAGTLPPAADKEEKMSDELAKYLESLEKK